METINGKTRQQLLNEAEINMMYARAAQQTFDRTGRESALRAAITHEGAGLRKREIAASMPAPAFSFESILKTPASTAYKSFQYPAKGEPTL